jgi:diguanylate cyclase (GGDEF)-like protein
MPDVLILDDDRDFRELLQRVFTERSCTVLQASRISEARNILTTAKPDLIVVDGLLPDGTGIQFIEEFRRHDAVTPILFVSAFWRDLKTFRKLTQELGVALVLHKPIAPLEFSQYLDRLLAPAVVEKPLATVPETAGTGLSGAQTAVAAPDIQDALQAMRLEFEGRLGVRFQELAAAIAAAKDGKAGAHEESLRLVHRLRGTAGSYGFHEVSAAAAEIEDALRVKEPDWGVVGSLLHHMIATANIGQGEEVRDSAWVAHLLLVHPDADMAADIRHIADQNLIRLTVCHTVAQAVQVLGRLSFDGVVIDRELLLRCGDELHAARTLQDGRKVPLAVVAVMGDDNITSRIEAQHAGAALFLTLPIDAPLLLEAARHLVAAAEAAQPKVLIVDDDPDFARLIEEFLKSDDIASRHLADPAELLDVLEEEAPDVMLLDVDLPGMSGFDICRMLRTHSRWYELPILFLTSHTEVEAKVVAYQAGGDDYLCKPVVREELLARVRLRLERSRLMRENRDHDSLTGLLLRRPFLTALAARLQEAKRNGEPLAVAMLDVDRFKHVNDTYGHAAGDGVLVRLGTLLGSRFRSGDLRARWGGEELAVAFYGQTGTTAKALVERLLGEFGRMRFAGDHGEEFGVTFSGGIAVFPKDGDDVETLLRVADQRLFQAKEAGRNRIRY